MPVIFEDRSQAGRLLAAQLLPLADDHPIVLALLRGGVPVGYEVASALRAPLDILAVRKLGVPGNPELGFGAIAAGGARVIDERMVTVLGLMRYDIRQIEMQEQEVLEQRQRTYRGAAEPPALSDRTVILVDDGLATGITMRVAVTSVRQDQAGKVVVAVPVCAPDAARGLRSILRPDKDALYYLAAPEDFMAVSEWYDDFHQVTDDEITQLLEQARRLSPA